MTVQLRYVVLYTPTFVEFRCWLGVLVRVHLDTAAQPPPHEKTPSLQDQPFTLEGLLESETCKSFYPNLEHVDPKTKVTHALKLCHPIFLLT